MICNFIMIQQFIAEPVIPFSHDQGITEWLELEETSRDDLLQPTC